jgi:DNA topoisomerase-1
VFVNKPLVIVESPAKARTINKFLGKDFVVKASVGHIKDLPENKLGVDVDHGFEPQYVIIKGKEKVVRELKKAGDASDDIYLAPDPDREGEAIAWHIAEELGDGDKRIHRVRIYEITHRAVKEALTNPEQLQESLYQAQQARRVLDRLVGYKISPLLWKKVKRGLSAGRVQSVALKIICDREREILDFVSEEYWSITARVQHPATPPPFDAKLTRIHGKKAEIRDQESAEEIRDALQGQSFLVRSVEQKEKRRQPPPPFITSTLQQEASRKLRFPAKKTMRVAQQLYEGIDLGEQGTVGLITYMRTDSFRVSQQALHEARALIKSQFGDDFLPTKPNVYRSRAGAQEAHEAIRPTTFSLAPGSVKAHLTRDQYSLYAMIWNRFLACQMRPAVYDQTTITIDAGDYLFVATGRVMKFAGFTALYVEGKDDGDQEEQTASLPMLHSGDRLELLQLTPKQHFTQPPPRFTESTLVKELEDKGIGRPSTYAAILSTIQDKRYASLVDRKFEPTHLGFLLADLLTESFPSIMDVRFTAMMEANLDKIEARDLDWKAALSEFYSRFVRNLEQAESQMRDIKREKTPTDIVCDRCGKPMEIRWGKYGEFLSCSAYPTCKNAKMFSRAPDGTITIEDPPTTEERCPKCGSPMVIKEGRFGRFLACSRYPECKGTKPIGTGVTCPREGCGGELVEKRTKRRRIFYGCSNYPACDYASWHKPVSKPCPKCGAPFLLEKRTKRGIRLVCPEKDCGFDEAAD